MSFIEIIVLNPIAHQIALQLNDFILLSKPSYWRQRQWGASLIIKISRRQTEAEPAPTIGVDKPHTLRHFHIELLLLQISIPLWSRSKYLSAGH